MKSSTLNADIPNLLLAIRAVLQTKEGTMRVVRDTCGAIESPSLALEECERVLSASADIAPISSLMAVVPSSDEWDEFLASSSSDTTAYSLCTSFAPLAPPPPPPPSSSTSAKKSVAISFSAKAKECTIKAVRLAPSVVRRIMDPVKFPLAKLLDVSQITHRHRASVLATWLKNLTAHIAPSICALDFTSNAFPSAACFSDTTARDTALLYHRLLVVYRWNADPLLHTHPEQHPLFRTLQEPLADICSNRISFADLFSSSSSSSSYPHFSVVCPESPSCLFPFFPVPRGVPLLESSVEEYRRDCKAIATTIAQTDTSQDNDEFYISLYGVAHRAIFSTYDPLPTPILGRLLQKLRLPGMPDIRPHSTIPELITGQCLSRLCSDAPTPRALLDHAEQDILSMLAAATYTLHNTYPTPSNIIPHNISRLNLVIILAYTATLAPTLSPLDVIANVILLRRLMTTVSTAEHLHTAVLGVLYPALS